MMEAMLEVVRGVAKFVVLVIEEGHMPAAWIRDEWFTMADGFEWELRYARTGEQIVQLVPTEFDNDWMEV